MLEKIGINHIKTIVIITAKNVHAQDQMNGTIKIENSAMKIVETITMNMVGNQCQRIKNVLHTLDAM